MDPASVAGIVLVNKDRNGTALQGYDAVAYFTDNKAEMGDADFRTLYLAAQTGIYRVRLNIPGTGAGRRPDS